MFGRHAWALWPLALAVVTVGLSGACSSSDDQSQEPPRTGAAIYRAVCATCHGQSGQGFVGPSLYDVAARYPDQAEQIALVTNGRAQMPAFGGQLTPEQISTVVDYTRTRFAVTSTTVFIGPTLPPKR
jgi:mono/diheme cytochrome c family protein